MKKWRFRLSFEAVMELLMACEATHKVGSFGSMSIDSWVYFEFDATPRADNGQQLITIGLQREKDMRLCRIEVRDREGDDVTQWYLTGGLEPRLHKWFERHGCTT